MKKPKIVWNTTAKQTLEAISIYYNQKSGQGANKVLNEILKTLEEIRFIDQYQKDLIQPEFRRIIVRHYKIIYHTENDTIFILRIFDTRQDPNKQHL